MEKPDLNHLIKSKPENRALISKLKQFLSTSLKESHLDDDWVNNIWSFINSYELPDLAIDAIKPLWNRLLLDGSPHLRTLFLQKLYNFAQKSTSNKQYIKLYQNFNDDLLSDQ